MKRRSTGKSSGNTRLNELYDQDSAARINPGTIRVGLVDDHKSFCESLAFVINTFKTCRVVLQAENGIDLEEKLKKNKKVDVILMDINMPLQNGIITCKKVKAKYPKIKIAGLSGYDHEDLVTKMIEAGADGYLTKNIDLDILEKAIYEIHKKGFYLDPCFNEEFRDMMLELKRNRSNKSNRHSILSPKEQEVLDNICEQKSNKEIAESLSMSERTVEFHRQSLIRKTNSKNMYGAIIYAFNHGLIDNSEQIIRGYERMTGME